MFKNNEIVNIFGRWDQVFYFQSAFGAILIADVTATILVANDFAEEEQNFVKLTEGMTEVSE